MVTNIARAGGSADTVFRAVADPTRRAILRRLATEDLEVGRLARHFPMSRPAISKHLRQLREAHLVVARRAGRRNVYRLNARPLRKVDGWLEEYRRFWERNLLALKKFAEREGPR
ncbi:MAG: ArsR/SmtB family transcription factor [Thermoanaerobaculia bacterium]